MPYFHLPSPWAKKTEALINMELVKEKEAESRNKWTVFFAFGEMHNQRVGPESFFKNLLINGLE